MYLFNQIIYLKKIQHARNITRASDNKGSFET